MQKAAPKNLVSPAVINYLIFAGICLIWGSSFILMKLGLYDNQHQPLLSPYQVAAIRILTGGVVLLPVLIKNRSKIPFKLSGWMVLSGLLSSFVPAFLFCLAETQIDSSLAGTLNSLTPIFAIIFGFIFFGIRVPLSQVMGIIIGFGGILLLYFVKKHGGGQIAYAGLVILATILYGINVVIVKRYLNGVSALVITSFSLIAVAIPAFIMLWHSGFFELPLAAPKYVKAWIACITLGMLGNAAAWLLFYLLVQRTNVLFATTANYGLPFVALGWGWFYGEAISWPQIGCLLIILCGVYLTRIEFKKRTALAPQP